MRSRTAVAAVAVGAALTLVVTACSSSNKSTNNNSTTATAKYNAAVGSVFNPSTKKGGTIRMANSGDWDSLDGADNYYGYEWDFQRLYARSLTMFATKPGIDGAKIVPDLATDLGKPSDDAKTWTYKLRSGLKFEDGTPITSKDVKYAVERSLDKTVFPDGPTYLNDFLDLQGYTSPYNDPTPDKLGLKAIETPDDTTIIFHLVKPFSGFDYFAMMPSTAPVPRLKDNGSKYKEHVISSGPYMFSDYQAGKSFTLVRNPNWDPATDPNRAALPDKITMELKANPQDIDARLLSGQLDMDVVGTGVQAATQSQILADQAKKANADLASQARLWYASINPDVKPLDNIDCRKAIEYAADHEGFQRAFGGPTGGDIATNMMPQDIPGATKFDLYDFGGSPNGNVDKAKAALASCGHPDGFSIAMSYRSERPKEKAEAESLQQSLGKVGIKLDLKPFPQGDYFTLYAGKPDYAKANNIGLMANGWGADWPDGFGFLSQITDSRTIRPQGGNYNLSVKVPAVDALFDQAVTVTNTSDREKIWGQIDKAVMENASVLPGVWAKTLLYRSPNLTNIYVNDGLGGYYDYVSLGVK
jgi:peptide/nickel transport system substrate-binding protein